MDIVRKQTVEMLVVADILCNICGETLCWSGRGPWIKDREVGRVEALTEAYGVRTEMTGGFSSKFVDDCKRYEFAICERCIVQKVFPLFTLPAIVTGYMGHDLHETWKEKYPEEFEKHRYEIVGLDHNANMVVHAATQEEFDDALRKLRPPPEGGISVRFPDAIEASTKEE